MIKNVPDEINWMLTQKCGGVICAEIICEDYDRKKVQAYLTKMTNKLGNEKLKEFIINELDGDYSNELIVGKWIDESEFDEILGDDELEEATLSFNFKKLLDMKYTNTDKGFFLTTNDCRIQVNGNDYGEKIEPAFDKLEEKFPGITYTGMYCYYWTDENGGDAEFYKFGDEAFCSGKVDEFFCSKLNKALKAFIKNESFDDYENTEEDFEFFFENELYEQIEMLINSIINNEDCADYLSSEYFERAVNMLIEKNILSNKLSDKLLDSDAISDSLRDLLEEYGENDPDDDE